MSSLAQRSRAFLLLGVLCSTMPSPALGRDSGKIASDRVGDTKFKVPSPCAPATDPGESRNTCLECHRGIERIRCGDSGMFQAILRVARREGHENRCVVCHGGDPKAGRPQGVEFGTPGMREAAKRAHGAGVLPFYPDPGSLWIADKTCGRCHESLVRTQFRSLMMTEAGKIQGTSWGFGGLEGYHHGWANQDVLPLPEDQRLGTEAYKKYMDDLARREPGAFPRRMQELPEAPRGGSDVESDPRRAAFTYIRAECQRCHLGVKGIQRRGDYRGLGCSACHIPYSNEGFYEGGDEAIPKDRPGWPLVHTIQSSRRTPVTVGKATYTGIPVETCTTCHNRGRRIGVSFEGLMETPYPTPFTPGGGPQVELHGKHYLKLQPDVHVSKGFLCQDCHTTLDVHSSGMLVGTVQGAVEVECTDCHGTPDRYPWELPLGYGDEYALRPKTGPPRGTADKLPDFMASERDVPPEDGYLLSARGNPLGNAVRTGNLVKVYLASGRTWVLKPLKLLMQEGKLSREGRVAMGQVHSHIQRMECYACHSTWAPQCYGCHIKIDYSKEEKHTDWVLAGKLHAENGLSADMVDPESVRVLRGKITESRSYLRFEDPPLGVNGEGRVSPVIPGCQTTVTIVGRDGEEVLRNHIFRVPNVEGSGPEGQLATDMAPLHPHTVQRHARDCASCHGNPKAAGYGILGGRVLANPSKPHYVELSTGDGNPIPKNRKPQQEAVENLSYDWSRFVSEDGKQLQTVGHHFSLSGPLGAGHRGKLDRWGTCVACHQEIPVRSVAAGVLHWLVRTVGADVASGEAHEAIVHKSVLIAAWVQVLAPLAAGVLLALFLFKAVRKRRVGLAAGRSRTGRRRHER